MSRPSRQKADKSRRQTLTKAMTPARPRSTPEAAAASESWRKPLRRVQRALKQSVRHLEATRRVVEAGERFVRRGGFVRVSELRELRPLRHTQGWLCEAADCLDRARQALRATHGRLLLTPRLPEGAPDALFGALGNVVALYAETAQLTQRFAAFLSRVAVTRSPGAQLPKGHPPVVATTPFPNPAPSRAASAFRWICRGRAPPRVSSRHR
jgi:hypothetical protein